MPSPQPPTTISRRDFRAPPIGKRQVPDLPARGRQLIDLMTFGPDDGSSPPMTIHEAAAHMGITLKFARSYFRHHGARRYYMQLLQEMQDSERARNLHTVVGIRDDASLKETAAGQKVRLEAVRHLDGEKQGGAGVTVNLGIGVQVTPGYVIDLSEPGES
jgi:hypothetical protein